MIDTKHAFRRENIGQAEEFRFPFTFLNEALLNFTMNSVYNELSFVSLHMENIGNKKSPAAVATGPGNMLNFCYWYLTLNVPLVKL